MSYKLTTLAHTIRTTSFGQPTYLRELGILPDYESVRTLRSSSRHLLQETVTKTVLPPGVSDILLLLSGTVYLTLLAVVLILTVLNVISKLTSLI